MSLCRLRWAHDPSRWIYPSYIACPPYLSMQLTAMGAGIKAGKSCHRSSNGTKCPTTSVCCTPRLASMLADCIPLTPTLPPCCRQPCPTATSQQSITASGSPTSSSACRPCLHLHLQPSPMLRSHTDETVQLDGSNGSLAPLRSPLLSARSRTRLDSTTSLAGMEPDPIATKHTARITAQPHVPALAAGCPDLAQQTVWGRFGFVLSGQSPCCVRAVATVSEAEQAGVVPGDNVHEVNGNDVRGSSLDDVLQMLRYATRLTPSPYPCPCLWSPPSLSLAMALPRFPALRR